jgi:hypothetical protein
MGGALLQRRGRWRHPAGALGRGRLRPADHLARLRGTGSVGRGAEPLTLDDLITGAWQALSGCDTAHCPVCGGAMGKSGGRAVVYCSHAEQLELYGECVDCGTRLS